jgi:hypothetical protein
MDRLLRKSAVLNCYSIVACQIVFDCLDSEPFQLVSYSSMFSSTATILSTMSMSTATTVLGK